MAISKYRKAGKKDPINPETQNQEKDPLVKTIIQPYIMLEKMYYNLLLIYWMIKSPKEFSDSSLLKSHLHHHQLNL
jgi:hypothetical protein